MTGIYRDVMPAIVRVLAADAIDNTAKQSWQRLIDRKVDGGFRALLSAQDQFEFDCILRPTAPGAFAGRVGRAACSLFDE